MSETEVEVGEAIRTLRAVRRFKSDTVSDADLEYMVAAATQASSAENKQPWSFVVLTDRKQLSALGGIYRSLGENFIRDQALASGRLSAATEKTYQLALGLAERMPDVPAAILVCITEPMPKHGATMTSYYGSIYPAIQNLMLAARGRGLGTTLTTLHKAADAEVKSLLGIPEGVETVALIPVGYPSSDDVWQKPKRRKPIADVLHRNRWRDR